MLLMPPVSGYNVVADRRITLSHPLVQNVSCLSVQIEGNIAYRIQGHFKTETAQSFW